MRNKKDLYIHYKRSCRKRRKVRGDKTRKAILVVIITVGLCLVALYVIKTQTELIDKKELDLKSEITENEGIQIEEKGLESINSNKQTDTTSEQNKQQEVVQEETNTNQKPIKAKGIYVSAAKAESASFDALTELVDTTELNTMVIDIKDDFGRITYQMDSALAKETGAVTNYISDMNTLVKYLKEKEIYLIARIVAFKDPYLAEQKQDLAIKNKDGSVFRDSNNDCWVNPYKKWVWEYLIDISEQAIAIGFDEIQFDYIRFEPGMTEVDFGVEAGAKTKEEIMIEFTKYAYEQLKPRGIFVSADVFGTVISSSIDAGRVGQNYVEMSKYLDYICPMIYPSHFGEGNYGVDYPDLEPNEIIRKVLIASKTKLEQIPEGEHRAIVRPWLQDFTASWLSTHQTYGAMELQEQINGVYSAGYEEWLLWNGSSSYSEGGLYEE